MAAMTCRLLLGLLVGMGCGVLQDEEPGMPPPVGNAQGSNSGAGGASETGEGGGDTTGAVADDDADSTGAIPDIGLGVLLIGEVELGDGAWIAPLDCAVRFFLPDQLDPQSGAATEWEGELPIVIDAFPYTFSITRDDVPDTIAPRTEGYVGIRCDFDGDGVMDNVGAFHPELPAELVTLPFDGVTLSLAFL